MMGMDIPFGSLKKGDVIIDEEGDEAVFICHSTTKHFGFFRYEGLGSMKMPISGLRLKERADVR
jgi:hypothetical protein